MAAKRQHWIYTLGDATLRESAAQWRDRKTTQGKLYETIQTNDQETPAGRLALVGNDDVLYVYAITSPAGIGLTHKSPAELAALLAAEGLDPAHRDLKLFFSRSGDTESGSPSYAEALYEAMRSQYLQIVVYGFLGDVSPEGFESHKSAGLAAGETPAGLNEDDWNTRRLRAKLNRVQFPKPAER
ncbi:MAG: hypothetical protein U0Q18_07000 [Bryobacteraceae bacterium]